MLALVPLGAAALADAFGQVQRGSGGGSGGGGSGGGGSGGGPATAVAVFTDRRGMLSGLPTTALADPDPGIGIKAPVRVATTGAAIVLAGLQTIDGAALSEGDRVLVKDQADLTQNGIYAAASSAWERVEDASDNEHFAPGMIVEAAQGTMNAGALFTLSGPATMQVVLGSSALIFSSVSVNPPMVLPLILSGGGTTLRAGLQRQVELPCRFTIRRWTILADAIGSATFDIWAAPFASLPLTSANSITGGAPPALSNQRFAQAVVPSSWSTGMAAGLILGVNVSGVAGIGQATLSLYGSRP